MSERAESLSEQIRDIGAEILSFIATCPNDGWRAVTKEEQWPICVVCRHIARAFEVQPMVIQQVAAGQSPSTGYTWEMIHESNVRQAREWADSNTEEVLALLHRSHIEAAEVVQHLSDEQLTRTAQLPILDAPISVEAMIEGMIDHARMHLRSARATLQDLDLAV